MQKDLCFAPQPGFLREELRSSNARDINAGGLPTTRKALQTHFFNHCEERMAREPVAIRAGAAHAAGRGGGGQAQ